MNTAERFAPVLVTAAVILILATLFFTIWMGLEPQRRPVEAHHPTHCI